MTILDRQDRGFSTIAALLLLSTFAAVGSVLAYMTSAGHQSRTNHYQSMQSMYVSNAAIEYSLKNIYDHGTGEVAIPVSFGAGSFTVSRAGATLTATGSAGETVRSFRFDSPTETDCTTLNTSGANLQMSGSRIAGITITKTCLVQITIISMQFSWVPNGSQLLRVIRVQGQTVYDNPVGVPSGTFIDIADVVMTVDHVYQLSNVDFYGSIAGTTVTMTISMADGTSQTVSFTPV